mmetsp:Transcript_2521/g.4013  ORF Transcript_2521/g.4013 Transcript_2521/m.4013 type:complete len:483 (+) Transcript_2521:2175-3623(+)
MENSSDILNRNTHGLNLRVMENVFDARKMGLFSLNVSLDEDSTDRGSIWESLDLILGNRSHQSSLSRVVSSEKTVVLATLEAHLGVVQQNLGTVGKSEVAVAKLLSIILIIVIIRDDKHLLGFFADLLNCGFGLVGRHVCSKKFGNILLPLSILHETKFHHGGGHDRSMLNDLQQTTIGVLLVESSHVLGIELRNISTDSGLLIGHLLEALELGNSLLGDLTSLWVSNSFGIGFEGREKKRKERTSVDWVVDKLTHVIDNNSRLTLSGNLLLSESTEQKRHNHGKSWRFYTLDEGYSGHLVHDLWDLLWLGDSSQNLASHVLNISVSNHGHGVTHGFSGSNLDLLLGVPHTGGNFWNALRKGLSELFRRRSVKDREALETELAHLPLLLNRKLGENHWKKSLQGKWVDVLADSKSGFLSQLAHISALVGSLVQANRKALLVDGLSLWGTFGNSLDGGKTRLGLGLVRGTSLGLEGLNVRHKA